jgi:4-amino-4-deoxychorismate lyase
MTESTWINGKLTALLNSADRGLQYGDGLFETLAVFEGRPQLVDAHLERLHRGAARLHFPELDIAGLERDIRNASATAQQAVLKLILTRGLSTRGYRPPDPAYPTRVVTLSNWPDYPQTNATQGVRARVCRQRMAIQPALAGIKHLNRLEQVLARAEWSDPDIVEGLMLDTEGRVVCGCMSNLFLVRDRKILTPSVQRCGVRGVMRDQVRLACRELGLGWQELDLTLEDVHKADELMLSNALVGLWPIRELDGRVLGPHSVCRELRSCLGHMGVRQCVDS